jgi:ElaB/YqjD/DUF883 family membrane-anchored ribosome-binding protein
MGNPTSLPGTSIFLHRNVQTDIDRGFNIRSIPMSGNQFEDVEIPSLNETTRAARDALRESGRKASAIINDLGNQACDTGARTRDQIVRQVESQPLTSVLLAAGIGLLAGVLLSRR